MGVYKFLSGIASGKPINVYGNGLQTRSLTFVKDTVNVINATLNSGPQNLSFDVSGNVVYSVMEIISECEAVIGKSAKVKFIEAPPGDQVHTQGDSTIVRELFGLNMDTGLRYGLEQQLKQMNS
jgi:UDP-glucose 4-epimerase